MRSELEGENVDPGPDAARADAARLRVLMVAACPFPAGRGTPIRIARMAEALANHGHHVHVVTYHLGDGEPPRNVVVHRTPRVRTYSRTRPGPSYQKLLLMDPILTMTMRRVVRMHRFDVVHAHHVEGLAAAMLARPAGVPVVFDAHTLLRAELPQYRLGVPKRVLERVGGLLDGFLPARADHVIAVTRAIAAHLQPHRGATGPTVTVIENGVLWQRFQDAPEGRPARPGPVLVFAGNMASYQGIEKLLEAFALVRRAHPQARLVLATEDARGFERYRSRAERLNLAAHLTVRPTPFAELPGVLASASVGVSPRTAGEGMAMKVLNYMAAGLPTVSFRGSAGGLEHSRTGWVVPNDDIPAFASGISRLLEDPAYARSMGERARAAVRDERSWDSVAAKVEDVYRSMLAAKREVPRW